MSACLQVKNCSPVLATLIALGVACPGALTSPVDGAEPLARIQSPAASFHEQAVAFEELATTGGPESVASLAKLLDDPRRSHYARYALQSNPAPAAGAALRDSLARLQGDRLIGVVNSLASRGDQQAVTGISRLLLCDDEGVVIAAAGALATIGTDTALVTLEEASRGRDVIFADALLQAARVHEKNDQPAEAQALLGRLTDGNSPVHVKQAAALALVRVGSPEKVRAMIARLLAARDEWAFQAGLQASIQAGSTRFANELVTTLPQAPPDRQPRLLAAIKTKKGIVSLDAIRDACESQDGNVRIAAISTLGVVGTSGDGSFVVRLALDDPRCLEVAMETLEEIDDPQLDGLLFEMLESQQPAEQTLAAEVLGLRRNQAASRELFDLARTSESATVRAAALGAIRRVTPGSALGQALDLIQSAQGQKERQLVRIASLDVARRTTDTEAATDVVAERLERWPASDCRALLDVLAQFGNSRALQLVAAVAEHPDRKMQDEATRALGNWPTADAAPVLFRLSRSNSAFAERTLRGYLRIARQFNLGEGERLNMCSRALAIARRDEERMLALQILAMHPSPQSLDLAASQLSPDLLGAKAGEVVVAIAESVATTNPQAASAAAAAVIKTGGDQQEQVIARARKLLEE